jgi:hypothetical protein
MVLPTPQVANGAPVGLSGLTNFRAAVLASGAPEPDFYELTSSPVVPIDQVLAIVPARSVLLTDFKWQQNPVDSSYNPASLTAATVAAQQFDLVRARSLAGWWVWAYRDGSGGEGFRGRSPDDAWRPTAALLAAENRPPSTALCVNELQPPVSCARFAAQPANVPVSAVASWARNTCTNAVSYLGGCR